MKVPEASADAVVRKLWQFCNVLRDDGLSYPDYVEQLTYLLFLKMASEEGNVQLPREYSWDSFQGLDANTMYEQYNRVLNRLGDESGMLGLIFSRARNKINDPAKLRLLVEQLIGGVNWSLLSSDVKGDAYEGLLEKNARDTKSGAGQYFTPRPLVDVMVECLAPQIEELICDPACGTGGFLLSAHSYLRKTAVVGTNLGINRLRGDCFLGVELVEEVARLGAMNLYLHGIDGSGSGRMPILRADSLENPLYEQADVVLTNPPFGTKGSITYVGGDGKTTRSYDDLTVARSDFTIQTANKQLNFLQHSISLLRPRGRAGIIVPDNVLYEAGAAASLRARLLSDHTIRAVLRLPTGLFYAQGVKASVLFFSKGRLTDSVDRGIWTYDLRTDRRFSLKSRPLRHSDLDDFLRCFLETPDGSLDRSRETQLWRVHLESELLVSGANFDSLWRSTKQADDESSSQNRLDELAAALTSDLEAALQSIRKATQDLK